MSSTTFIDGQTVVAASWANDVNTAVYTAIGDGTNIPTTATDVKTNLSLNLVNNTSDINKPISTATQTALNLKQDAATAVTITGTQTLTNKTLTTPTINTSVNYSGTSGIIEVGGIDALEINASTNTITALGSFVMAGNGPAFYATINVQSVGAGTTTVLSCTEVLDTNSNFTANTFTATIAGWYMFSVNIQTNQPDNDAGCLISKNAVIVARDIALGLSAGEGSGSYASANWLGYLAVSDYVAAGAILTVAGFSVTGGNFSGVLVRAA